MYSQKNSKSRAVDPQAAATEHRASRASPGRKPGGKKLCTEMWKISGEALRNMICNDVVKTIVDLPIEHSAFLIVVLVYQRVPHDD